MRRARELPPRVVVAKAIRLAARTARQKAKQLRDTFVSSYGSPISAPFNLSLTVPADALDNRAREDLRFFVSRYLSHQFDILGSGHVDVGYGGEADGLENVRYVKPTEFTSGSIPKEPWRQVSRASRARARRIFQLIDDPEYQPIDWQWDMRSGYRWSAKTHWQRLRIGMDRGADIKMPWELSRMQHLPQLAFAALLSLEGHPHFAPPGVYVAEIRNQMLDFLATNPPRHGACWGCPMDVSIRAANWVVAIGLLNGVGLTLDAECMGEVLGGLKEAATFVTQNLEWAERGRSNHYLADLAGLLFTSAALPRSPTTRTWMNFAAREMCSECIVQFHKDGGNYEGSTSYHRLSGELATYTIALTEGLAAREPDIFKTIEPTTLDAMGVPLSDPAQPIDQILAKTTERLSSVLRFTHAMARPDGTIIQIGDTDSGRLFKLAPRLTENLDNPAGLPQEAQLHIDELLDALSYITAQSQQSRGIGGALAAGLAAGAPLRRALQKRDSCVAYGKYAIGSRALLQELKANVLALPEHSRRYQCLPLPNGLERIPVLSMFPDFGLYCLTTGNFYLAFRCAKHARNDAPSGHTHDDNLTMDVVVDGQPLVTDPGTYVYTSFPELRDAYRMSGAHFVPRANEFCAVATSDYLFHLKHEMVARCVLASQSVLAGILEGDAGQIIRVVEITDSAIEVLDGVVGGTLAKLNVTETIAIGYGKKTARPAFVI